MIYLIGSLRNPEIPKIANRLRQDGWEVFDDWYAAGPEADDKWRDYEKARGHSYIEALSGHAAKNVYAFDRKHLDRCRAAVLVLPAGKSGHLELGYILGTGRPGYILLDAEPERFDIMYQFATGVFDNLDALLEELKRDTSTDIVREERDPNHWVCDVAGVNCGGSDCTGGERDLWGV